MRIAYLDCSSGISGDMTLAALVDAGADLAVIQAGIDSLRLPSCQLLSKEVKKQGFRATQISVTHEPEHAHRHLHHILEMIHSSSLTNRQQELATRIFKRLAEAEAKVHGTTMEKVHFHEVGAVDSIADIVGAAIAFDLLEIERVVCSPIPTGHGFVEIAHGRCSIPAPATAELLKDVPLAASDTEGELTTPTGAAIVAALADEFGPLPAMTVERIGYGAGQMDFAHPNILRVMIGWEQSGETKDKRSEHAPITETIVLLETNIDDASGEMIGHAVDRLWDAGALDVTVTAIQMKKARPGVLLSVQALPGQAEKLRDILLYETPTLGVRRRDVQRFVLPREAYTVTTRFGAVPGKLAHLPNGKTRFVPEYEDCHRLAMDCNVTLGEVLATAQHDFHAQYDT